jgi:hypothetical protein
MLGLFQPIRSNCHVTTQRRRQAVATHAISRATDSSTPQKLWSLLPQMPRTECFVDCLKCDSAMSQPRAFGSRQLSLC